MRHGILLIDKPVGPTSNEAVQTARNALHERKIGHLGTLDPAASGLLVLFVGRKALKTVELFGDATKEYEARILFGKVSSTYDREGVIEDVPERKGWKPPTESQLNSILKEHFLGEILQTPPPYSAVHVAGKRAYEIIRENPSTRLELPERNVTISGIRLISYAYPKACVSISCSSGTYIRSFAHDLGRILRCGAYLEGLRRTKVGKWRVEEACTTISWTGVLPLKEVLTDFHRCELSSEQWDDVQHGRSIDVPVAEEPVIAWFDGLPVAILERKNGETHPRKVL